MGARKISLLIVFTLTAFPSFGSQQSSYAGEQNRLIKSLSANEIKGYTSGAGMGFAKAAELNRFPGPKHVLELATQLNLVETQRRQTERLFNAMQREAKVWGEKIIAEEKRLDWLFRQNRIDEKKLRYHIDVIAQHQGELRFVHLRAHLKQKEILTEKQISLYARLRGYEGGDESRPHHHTTHNYEH